MIPISMAWEEYCYSMKTSQQRKLGKQHIPDVGILLNLNSQEALECDFKWMTLLMRVKLDL